MSTFAVSSTVTVALSELEPILFEAVTEILTVAPFDTPKSATLTATEPLAKSANEKDLLPTVALADVNGLLPSLIDIEIVPVVFVLPPSLGVIVIIGSE